MSADWYPGIRAFCAHWKHAPMLQQTFETLEREFADENDACIGDVRHREFADLIKHHNNMTDSLRRLRNEAGTVSHGKDGFIAKLSVHHRRSSLLAADAIVTFLHSAYLEREPDPVRTFEPYERFEASNAIIDEFATLRTELDEEGFIRAVVVLPDGEEVPLVVEVSRLLFGADREAYKLVLNACREAKVAAPQDAEVA